jgi:integrase/recombinase XerD
MSGAERARPVTLDIHGASSQISHETERLENGSDGLPTEATRAILAFADSRRSAVSPLRRLAYLGKLRSAAKKLGPDFLDPTRETPGKFLRAYRDAETWTQLTMRSVLFSFWKWRFAQNDQELPSWLRIPISKRNVNQRDHADVLDAAEVTRLADHTMNLRDRALIWTLYESGARIGELLALRVGDVELTDYGALRLYLPAGKTGRRTVPLFSAAVPNLLLWLKNHPHRDEKTAALWCGLQQGERSGEPIGYRFVVKLLSTTARRAGVSKPANPHNFRHSRATEIAQDPQVSTSVLEKFFGWQPGSPMAKTYVHLSGKDVEDALARAHGIEIGRSPATRQKRAAVCARCSAQNEPEARFCLQCGGPLSLEGAEDAEAWKSEERELARLLTDPAVRRFLARRLSKTLRVRAG